MLSTPRLRHVSDTEWSIPKYMGLDLLFEADNSGHEPSACIETGATTKK